MDIKVWEITAEGFPYLLHGICLNNNIYPILGYNVRVDIVEGTFLNLGDRSEGDPNG